MVSAVLDALATLPGPLLLAVVCAAALLETAVLAGLVLPGELVVPLGASVAAGGAAAPPLVVVAARFVGLVRPLAPPPAGLSGLPYRRFLPASVLGAVLWSILLVALGTAAGSSARAVADDLGRIGWGVVAIGVPVALVVAASRRRRGARTA